MKCVFNVLCVLAVLLGIAMYVLHRTSIEMTGITAYAVEINGAYFEESRGSNKTRRSITKAEYEKWSHIQNISTALAAFGGVPLFVALIVVSARLGLRGELPGQKSGMAKVTPKEWGGVSTNEGQDKQGSEKP